LNLPTNIPQFRKSAESATPTLERLGVLAVQNNGVLCKNLHLIMKTLQKIDWLKIVLGAIVGAYVFGSIIYGIIDNS
jgi:hypothetical protein